MFEESVFVLLLYIHTYTCYINCAKNKQTLCTACNEVECCASNGSHLNKLFEKIIVNY